MVGRGVAYHCVGFASACHSIRKACHIKSIEYIDDERLECLIVDIQIAYLIIEDLVETICFIPLPSVVIHHVCIMDMDHVVLYFDY